jgi:ANTAR domain/PAS fold
MLATSRRWARCLNDGMIINVHESAETSADTGEAPVGRLAYADHGNVRVGAFRFWFIGQRWEWSDEVALMHGYEPGSVVPTTELLLSHKHPEDREHVQDLLDRALHTKSSFSSRHRFIDVGGNVHDAIVVADRMADETGAVVGTAGHYIDLTATFVETRQVALDEALPDLFEARALIEQVKGVLMATYRVSADQAFGLLRWRSQETNTKLRALANQLIAEIASLPPPSAELQSAFDHLLLTVQERIEGEPDT